MKQKTLTRSELDAYRALASAAARLRNAQRAAESSRQGSNGTIRRRPRPQTSPPTRAEIVEYASKLFPRVAAAISRKPEFAGSAVGDLENDLWVVLLQRQSLYNRQKSKVSTFIVMVANDAVASMIRRRRAHKRDRRREECSFDDQVCGDDGENVSRESVLLIRDQERQRQLREDLDQVLDEAPEHLQQFAYMFMEGGNLSNAARRCGITRDKARWCVEALRERFADADLHRFV